MPSQESYLVIGGCGFVGRHIVEALLARGELQVAVFDLVQRHFDTNVQFFTGDITDEVAVGNAIQKTNATTIFHTVSPVVGLGPDIYQKVNVQGTTSIITASQAHGVKYLVFTSSAGLVFDGQDLIDVDERLPPPDQPMDAYNATKATAEKLVLEANGKEGLKTVSLRPSGIFGPGDRQGTIRITDAVKRGQTKVQIGSNVNLADWTYISNVVKAHLLAADKLASKIVPLSHESLMETLPTIALSTGERRIPTSAARPIGPAVIRPSNAAELEAAFRAPREKEERAFVRSRYDALGPAALEREEVETLQVAGQIFIITNGEPFCFWDFIRAMMLGFGAPRADVDRPKWTLPKTIGYFFAWAAEWASWASAKEPTFTRLRVEYMCATRYYNIEKARRVLGYEPDVGLKEGIEKTLEWWRTLEAESKEAKR
ncbi:C-3 sterol dehydrogenase [Ramaria rubella]|nr:C-3 sterol dehydrogenase [Ramaria rubella]